MNQELNVSGLPTLSFWIFVSFVFFRMSLVFGIYDIFQRIVFVLVCLAIFYCFFKPILSKLLNSFLFQYWFFSSLTLENFMLRVPAWYGFFSLLLWPYSLVWWTYYLSGSFSTAVNTGITLLFLYYTYFGFQKVFLTAEADFPRFDLDSSKDLTWDNVVKAISAFSTYYCGSLVVNRLGEKHLSRSFPYTAKRFMFKKAFVENMGRLQSFSAEHPDALKTIGGGLTAIGLGAGTLLARDTDLKKAEATLEQAAATRYAADKNFETAKYVADKNFEAVQLQYGAQGKEVLKEIKAGEQRSKPPLLQNPKTDYGLLLPLDKSVDQTEVKDHSLSIDKEEWYSKLLEIFF